jgi:adenosylhomocysteine nucleosidase
MKTIGVLGALPEEVELIVGALESAQCERYAGVDYHTGRRAGFTLVVCCAGMGKVNAAQATQVLITRYGAEAIVFSGVGGNMSADIGIGDVVIGEELVYHDAQLDMIVQSAPGLNSYRADPLLMDAAKRGCELAGVRYIVGRIATGDLFIGDAEVKRAIREKCNPACVEMEGAAVGHVAMRNDVPFVVLRAVSDNCEIDIETLRADAKTFDIT